MDGGEWFYLESGQQQGPVPLAELLGRLRSSLPAGTLVWRDDPGGGVDLVERTGGEVLCSASCQALQ